ncbi:discoidin domain-containing protein [Virgisporangium aurantiacum]|uniref:discoidin domain-containing protein n=1 Tax=Virgisporangium aurantiacum TaxID=175570 RepID=UPI0019506A9F|nr:discoidin domain-containing protein [Virgisporangium aurantiacum]
MRQRRVLPIAVVVLVALVSLLIGSIRPQAGATELTVASPLLGAVRWDFWYPGNARKGIVDPTLFTDFPSRQPVYGWYDNNASGGVPDHAAVMDRQITDAADRGLDYWAFVWYDPLQQYPSCCGQAMKPFEDYMASPLKQRMKFTFIIQSDGVAGGDPTDPNSRESHWRSDFVPHFKQMLSDPQYLKISGAGGAAFAEPRPVVYWFDTPALASKPRGFGASWATEMAYFIKEIDSVPGLGKPFFVDNNMNLGAYDTFGSANGQEFIKAVTSYGPSGASPGSGRQCWSAQAAKDVANRGPYPGRTGLLTVPGVTPVNDPRPRNPENYGFSYGFHSQAPTYSQWRTHLSSTYDWMRSHRAQVTDPPIALTYAWNELDEGGGGIIPTVQDGTRYLDAIASVESGRLPDTWDDVFNGDNCSIARAGSGWVHWAPSPGLYDDDEEISLGGGDTATLASDDTIGFEVTGTRGPNRGVMQIYIDNVLRATVQLNSSTWRIREVLYRDFTLPSGRHTVRLRNASTQGLQMGVDTITARVRPLRSGPNLALGHPPASAYTASSVWDGNQAAPTAFDGQPGTWWQAASGSTFNEQWLAVTFPGPTTFNRVVLSEYEDNRTTGYRIEFCPQVSCQDGQWQVAYTGTTIGPSTTATFPEVTGQRARIRFTAGRFTPIIFEFAIHHAT